MIDYINKIPEYYFKDSRDFQMLARLLTIGLSSSEYHSATLNHINNPKIINTIFLPYLLEKVGIVGCNYNFTDEQMIHICSSFVDIIKKKGTMTAVENLCKLYSTCSGATIDVVKKDRYTLYITYDNIIDEELLSTLIKYVIPIGVEYNIQNVNRESGYTNVRLKDNDFIVGHQLHLRKGSIKNGIPEDFRSGIFSSESSEIEKLEFKVNTTEVFTSEWTPENINEEKE